MEAKASARYIRIAPRKVRFVVDAIRGLHVQDALDILKFTPNAAAKAVEKVIKSAMANAENNLHISGDTLKVARATVDEGPRLKRIQPRAMGRAYRILKRTSHINVVLEETESRPRRATRKETAKAAKPARRGPSAARQVEGQAPGRRASTRAETAAPKAEKRPRKRPETEQKKSEGEE